MIDPNREVDWRTLGTAYKDHGLVLALGSGVSLDSCMPDWVGLLERVGRACCDQNGERLVSQLRGKGYSLPSIASALKLQCPEARNFTEVVREALYEMFPYVGLDIVDTDPGRFVSWIQAHNTTLSAVAAFCAIPGEKPSTYLCNPKLHAVVNFNLDYILREYVEARYGWPPILRTIERASKKPMRKRISVYHMHGNLRFDGKRHRSKEGADKMVLSEEEYFNYFNSPTSLFNYIFLSLLREHRVLFVGLSMQDDNIRRLLHYSTRELEQAYQEEGYSQRYAKQQAIRHFAILKWSESPDLDTARESTLERLGTQVLWVKDYKDIASNLGTVYETGDGNWSSVYVSEPRRFECPCTVASRDAARQEVLP